MTPKYPWDQWLDGQEWSIIRGRDYWGDSYQMVKRIRRAASRRKLKVDLDWSLPGHIVIKAQPAGGVA